MTLTGKAQSWQVVGQPGFSPDIAYHHSLSFSDSVPHAAFLDFEVLKISVMRYVDGGWEFLGNQGFSEGGTFEPISMDFDGQVPYVAFSDQAHENKLTVMKFDGSVWLPVGNPGFTTGAAGSASLVCHSGVPYVAFRDDANAGKASLVAFDGTDWLPVGGGELSQGSATFVRLAFDGNAPVVAFTDGSNENALTVKIFEGNEWVVAGVPGFTPPGPLSPDLAVSDGVFYVAFTDNSVFPARASVMIFDEDGWQFAGQTYCSPAAAPDVRLAVHNQTPYVLFTDQTQDFRTTCVYLNGSEWEPLGLPGFSQGDAADIDFAIHNGYAYALYRDFNFLSQSVLMRFDGPLQVEAYSLQNEVVLFPNPAQDELNVRLPHDFGPADISVSDSQGRLVHTASASGPHIRVEVRNLTAGVYVLSIEGRAGAEHRLFVKSDE